MPAPADRIEVVRNAAKRWQEQLVDTTGRNRLRNYRDLQTGTLDLTPVDDNGPDPWQLDRLLAGGKVKLKMLFPSHEGDNGTFDDARRRFSAIHRKAREHLEEKGIATLFAAIGLAKWEVDNGTAPNAPIILLPLKAEATGAARHDFTIMVSGDAHLNPVLTHILQRDHGINIEASEEEVVEAPTNLNDFWALLDQLAKLWATLPRFAIERRVVATVFSYATMPLVSDLEENAEMFAANDIIAAIAGDKGAREILARRICNPAPNQPDTDPPADEFLVLDADSSQHMAINRVLGGESLVIQGPPGTGKSQTIANLIAALTARGKRVLFVAAKRAAIEAVTKRLDRVNLGDLVMDMHGGITSRRKFARTLADSLRKVSTVLPCDCSKLHDDLWTHREKLLNHAAAVHCRRKPRGMSLYDMEERLLTITRPRGAIPRDARTQLRLSTSAARSLDGDGFEQLKGKIQEWIALDGHTFAEDHPEWFHSTIATSDGAREAFDLACELAQTRLPDARSALFAALDDAGLERPDTVAGWQQALRLVSSVERMLVRCSPEVYRLDHAALGAILEPAGGSFAGRLWAWFFSKEYRSALRSLRETVRQPTKLSATDALDMVRSAGNQLDEWRRRSVDGGEPRAPAGLDGARECVKRLVHALNALGAIINDNDLHERTSDGLAALLDKLASNSQAVANLPRLRELEEEFRKAEITAVLERVGMDIQPGYAADAVEYAWLSRVLDDLAFDDHRLSAFDAVAHSRHRDQFIDLDIEHRNSTPQRIQRLVAAATVKAMDEHPEETALIRQEVVRQRRHLSVRQLFARAPHVFSALRPCWTMSPVLATEMIPADLNLFDVVVFDEASQIPPAEAIGSLARAPQAVIAGDSRQLPPTPFFRGVTDDGNDEEEDAPALTANIESLLDVAGVLLRDTMLQWHYRSRDDRLIAFSNNHIYDGGLTAFPGSLTDAPVEYCPVPFRPLPGAGGTRSHPDEVEKVVDLVIAHARERPRKTLGVIAFGLHHANNIENFLLRRLGELNDPSLDEFFADTKADRFFVKSIERVQGDERDAIILSVGYHKNENGQLVYRFGPLNQEGGERRLNVAVTRARSRLTLVSSFSHRDMEPGHTGAKGVKLLRKYLEFAASGGMDLGADVVEVSLNPFELSIADGLKRRRIPFTPQYGVSGYRIDFACHHPDQPGRMVLAIEADGASYHSTPTARDRDRLRQQVLEDKGWRFHRIWSTAWFRNRTAELKKVKTAWQQAVAAADAGADAPPPAVEAVDTPPPIAEPPSAPLRGPRPDVPPRGTAGYNNITNYRSNQLVELARWIESDGQLRTEDQLMTEIRRELGFNRGRRIEQKLREAIKLARS